MKSKLNRSLLSQSFGSRHGTSTKQVPRNLYHCRGPPRLTGPRTVNCPRGPNIHTPHLPTPDAHSSKGGKGGRTALVAENSADDCAGVDSKTDLTSLTCAEGRRGRQAKTPKADEQGQNGARRLFLLFLLLLGLLFSTELVTALLAPCFHQLTLNPKP